MAREAWPHLVARGGGSIINVGSAAAQVGDRVQGGVAHAAAKGAIIATTRQLAVEGAAHGIRANSISPGLMRSTQTAPALENPEFIDFIKRSMLIPRVGEPEDIAEYAVFLASDESSYVTATDLLIDGGHTAV